MPVVFRHKGFRFFFYSNEGEPFEPLHVHVRKGESEAKLWLEPTPCVARVYGLTPKELREVIEKATENKETIRRYWNEHFGI